MLPHLQQVVVQPTIVKYGFRDPDPRTQDQLATELKACADNARIGLQFDICAQHDPLRPLHLLTGSESATQRCIRRAQQQWMKRIEGGPGYWTAAHLF